MNLKEIEEEETRRMTEGEDNDDDDEEVLPLDFRTALIEHENKVVIQAKPLQLKTDDELLREAAEIAPVTNDKEFESMESYLEAVKKEPFKPEESNVIMIDPDINIKEKFEQIDLACNMEQRINNTLNAPVRTREQMIQLAQQMMKEKEREAKLRMAPKIATKQYDTDTDGGNTENESPVKQSSNVNPANPMGLPDESMPHGYNKSNLDFN
jgi:hypothetical protein